ncbi:hypothetical protein M514_08627 [Trichuris suis]|nr:hypothetical protein M514_08627 [Trichuris suis]
MIKNDLCQSFLVIIIQSSQLFKTTLLHPAGAFLTVLGAPCTLHMDTRLVGGEHRQHHRGGLIENRLSGERTLRKTPEGVLDTDAGFGSGELRKEGTKGLLCTGGFCAHRLRRWNT